MNRAKLRARRVNVQADQNCPIFKPAVIAQVEFVEVVGYIIARSLFIPLHASHCVHIVFIYTVVPGADGAWGRYEFDPLGLSKKTELVPYFREAELKHGRLAMLAWLGLVAPDFVRLPGEKFSFEAVPVSIDAHDAFLGATGVNAQVLFWVGIVELCCAKKVFEWNSLEVAGDYGLTSLFPSDEEGQKKMRTAELKNGRLAMMAFAGAVTQAALTRHPFPWLF